jgi:hypothetical protein
VISARHGTAARNKVPRLRRPVDGLGIKIKIPQRSHTLANQAFGRLQAAGAKTSLTE